MRKTKMRHFAFSLIGLLVLGAPFAQENASGQTSSTQPAAAISSQVLLYVTVKDAMGRPVSSLKQEHFTIKDGTLSQRINFFSDRPVPTSVAVLFDVSRFIAAEKRKRATQLLNMLRRESLPTNEYLIAVYGEQEELLVSWTNQEEPISSALKRIEEMNPKGDAALYDALYKTLQRMDTARNQRHIIILVSNGRDSFSRSQGFKEARELVKHSDTALYLIGSPLAIDTSGYGMHAMDQLEELAQISGGSALFASTPDGITSAFERVATDLRYCYTLGFVGSGLNMRKWHPLTVLLDHPDIRKRSATVHVITRRGYYD